MSATKILYLLHNDFRLYDNPALDFAKDFDELYLLYIEDEKKERPLGAAAKVWLHHCLASFDQSVSHQLNLLKGDSLELIEQNLDALKPDAVVFSEGYEPEYKKCLENIKTCCEEKNIKCRVFNTKLLWDAEAIHKEDGTPYKVFTPFYRKGCLNQREPRYPLPISKTSHAKKMANSLALADLALLPDKDWHSDLAKHWDISEEGAQACLKAFIAEGLSDYKEGRNFPAQKNVSRLSPYLRFGQISPQQAWHAAKEKENSKSQAHFLSELGWREFSYYLLHQFPKLNSANFQAKFDRFSWHNNPNFLKSWQKGQTGYPIVDAGMRELYQTGYMHNRTRMIVGSFLVKNLLIDWREGEKWFWDCLFDADEASNPAGWQWVAGSGADAAPYFRVFNPVLQGKKFDPNGEYTKKYVPELKDVSIKYLFEPWVIPPIEQKFYGIKLGESYPRPIVDLARSRDAALEAFQLLKQG